MLKRQEKCQHISFCRVPKVIKNQGESTEALSEMMNYWYCLLVLLSGLKFTFDIIGLSETKEQCEKGFLTNVNLARYNIHSQPTKISNGGVTMYVKSSLNYKVREDLSVTKAEFEMICIELLNRTSKNTLCFCTYRHPNTDVQVFLDHMYNVL